MKTKITIKNPQLIYERMAENGFSIRGYAKKIDISNGYLSQILRGEINPSASTAKKIVDGFRLKFNEIFETTVEKQTA